jgi:2-amino-4-hydroxy-6-hydroxymethyldihydropteridine diphosphokinase
VTGENAAPGAARVFVGLGSNLGDRRGRIEQALEWLAGHPDVRLVRRSDPIETEPWGGVEQPLFLNAVAELETSLAPRDLLVELKRCEEELGRDLDRGQRWGPREIDLDILLFGDLTLTSPELTIPHPHLTEREFVLRQLRELDPGLKLPGSGRLVSSYLRDT